MSLNQLGNRNAQHSFAQIPDVHIQRSTFDRSHTVKDTIQFDELTPIYLDEIIPGDTVNLSLSSFGRLATQIVPIMDNMYLDFFFFFVPMRLVWDNWERFNGAQDNPGDSTDYLIPTLDFGTGGKVNVGDLHDHFGLPTGVVIPGTGGHSEWSALPQRCYELCFNEWFRDQNMQDSLVISKGDGPDPVRTALLKRGKRHDYVTSCLPWPQKGDPVDLPLGNSAPVMLTSTLNVPALVRRASTHALVNDTSIGSNASGQLVDTAGGVTRVIDPNGTLYADLSAATAPTINQLREAIMLQSVLELDARGGTRYVELLRAHFKVISPDFRLQRPEYLGGGEQKINSHPVAQTAPTSAGDTPQGNLAAFGTTQGQGIGFNKSFVEHGYVIGLCCPRADITYQQGVEKTWTRRQRFDFFWPKLQELGEQAVLNKEIYFQGSSEDDEAFGYQERYAEYRFKNSQIRGQFRSTYAQSLDYWHLAEEFGSLPALNETFIVQNTPIDRALSVTSGPDMLMDLWFNITHARPMLTYSVPATLGRF